MLRISGDVRMSDAHDRRDGGWIEHATAPLLAIYDGRRCIGFVLFRGGSGYEAFRADQTSLGLFPTQYAAIDGISGAAR
jgi:hypothetical protein